MVSAQGESGEEPRSSPDRSGDLADEALGEPGAPTEDEGFRVEDAGSRVEAGVVRCEARGHLSGIASTGHRHGDLSADDRQAEDRDALVSTPSPTVPSSGHAYVPPYGS